MRISSNVPDYTILNCVIPKLIDDRDTGTRVIGMEVLDGPYKGVTFRVTRFRFLDDRPGPDGLARVLFDTKVYSSPEGFQKDAAFDYFCADIIVAFLAYAAENDFESFMTMPVREVKH